MQQLAQQSKKNGKTYFRAVAQCEWKRDKENATLFIRSSEEREENRTKT